MTEFELIERMAPYLDGAGDDAAVVRVGDATVLMTTDVLVEGVHVDRALSSLADIGWKAIAVNVSDVAAMGGRPVCATVGLCVPPAFEGVEELYAGMDQACGRWGLRLVGGDTVAAGALVVSVTVLGEPPPTGAVLRSGARPGDVVVVAGELGAGAAALAQHRAGVPVDPRLLDAHRRPVARLEDGQALAAAGATAMIDVSDGLGLDLRRVCAASGVRAVVDALSLPAAQGVPEAVEDVWAVVCGGGEDYALVATLPADAGVGLVVGEVVEGPPGVELVLPDGSRRDIGRLGYEHLTGREPG